MLSNEQRAHDLAVATVTALTMSNALKANPNINNLVIVDAYKVYAETYFSILNCLNRDFEE